MSRSAIEHFQRVRGLPYTLDAAHNARELEEVGAGDCLAKAELLARRLEALGLEVRLVRWAYELPDVVPEVRALPERIDLHRAVEVRKGPKWILVDATHDPPLAAGGLTVGRWDGQDSTDPAYDPVGPILIEGRDDLRIETQICDIAQWTAACESEVLGRWRQSYIRWLADTRARATQNSPNTL